ncbi:MAG: type II toxin-antitoxin system PemK/MazF family toxin [Terriglobales bacterium]
MALDPSIPLDPGDIYWINLPHQGGSEQAGRRPCIVMSLRSLNTGNTAVVVPMSTNLKNCTAWKVQLPVNEIIKDIGCTSAIQTSVALCHQVRAVDKKQFDTKIGKLSQLAVLAVQLGITYLFEIR